MKYNNQREMLIEKITKMIQHHKQADIKLVKKTRLAEKI
jgi:hypothetical protein